MKITICGSPRRGNSEAILNRLKQIFEKNGIENELEDIALKLKQSLCDK